MIQTGSLALMVPSEATVRECIDRMKEFHVGSALIVDSEESGQLVGIFTERDLLRKIDLIQNEGHWNKPIKSMMTRPVMTLPVSRLSEASQIMLENGFRHLPIVAPKLNGASVLLGIISMRDLFRMHYEKSGASAWAIGAAKGKNKEGPVLFVLSPQNASSGSFQSEISDYLKIRVEEGEPTTIVQHVKNLSGTTESAVLMDLDDPRTAEWLKILKTESFPMHRAPHTMLLFNPLRHSQKTIGTLQKLELDAKISVFSKPVSLIEFLMKLDSVLKLS